MAEDRITLGLTVRASTVLNQLMDTGLFGQELDVAKFGLAFAIQRGATPAEVPIETTTKWNIGSFDQDGLLRSLIQVIYPNVESPVRAIEYLMNHGLHLLGDEFAKTGDWIELVFSLLNHDANGDSSE